MIGAHYHTLPQGGVPQKTKYYYWGDKTWKNFLLYVSFSIKFFGGLGVFREGIYSIPFQVIPQCIHFYLIHIKLSSNWFIF
jgi:hypothetical protein